MKHTPILLLGTLLAICSCNPNRASSQIDEVPPQPAIYEYSCRGTEPFWLIEIYKDSIVYQRSGGERLYYPYRKAIKQGDTTLYKTSTKVHSLLSSMTIKLVADSCSDGMSDKLYPYTAVVLRDGEVLNGCANSEPEK